MDQKTRRMIMMLKALNPRDDIDYICQEIEGGREHARFEDSVDASIHGLGDYIKNSKERQISATRKSIDSKIINRTRKQNN